MSRTARIAVVIAVIIAALIVLAFATDQFTSRALFGLVPGT
jgi:hypothetical protein